MADYTVFMPSLAGWVRNVWTTRAKIKAESDRQGNEDVQDLVDKGDAAARFRFTEFRDIEGTWQIYELYNDPGTVTVSNVELRAFLKRCRALAKRYGLRYAAQGGAKVADTFYHFNPRGGYGRIDYRVYARAKAPLSRHACHLANAVAFKMGDIPGIQKFKISGPGMTADRGDGLVVYLSDEASTMTLLEYLGRTCTRHFSGAVSPAVKQVQDGLGWAKEPPDPGKDHPLANHPDNAYSFGSYLAALIYVALKRTYFASMSTREDAFVAEVARVFEAGNVDPKNPHRPCASKEELEQLQALANGALVRDAAINGRPPGTAGAGHTNPMGDTV
ncbi:hypothetical protein DXV76_15575 [Rhodobacteraceae bacterium CCMM004]|nr:hypothetical protein DXV76_15575 [Rhodobacteraceae bacterium CCMM004]